MNIYKKTVQDRIVAAVAQCMMCGDVVRDRQNKDGVYGITVYSAGGTLVVIVFEGYGSLVKYKYLDGELKLLRF